jgi:hypothetical protein
VRDAVETRLSRAEWAKTLEFGDRNTAVRGLKPEDVETEIAGARSDRNFRSTVAIMSSIQDYEVPLAF